MRWTLLLVFVEIADGLLVPERRMETMNRMKNQDLLKTTKEFVTSDFGANSNLLSPDFTFTAAGRKPVRLRRFREYGYSTNLRKACPSLEIEINDLRFDDVESSTTQRVLYTSFIRGGKFDAAWSPPAWARTALRPKVKAAKAWSTGPLAGSVTYNKNDGSIVSASHGYPLDRTRNDAYASGLDACWLAAGGDAELIATSPGLFISESLRRFKSVEIDQTLFKSNDLAPQAAFAIVEAGLTSLKNGEEDTDSLFSKDCIILGPQFAAGSLQAIQFRKPWPKAEIKSLFNWRYDADAGLVSVDIRLDDNRLEQATAILNPQGRIIRLALGFRLDDQAIKLWDELPSTQWSQYVLPQAPQTYDNFLLDLDQYVKRTAKRSARKSPRAARELALDEAIDFITTPAEPPKAEVKARASRENAINDLLAGKKTKIKTKQAPKTIPKNSPPPKSTPKSAPKIILPQVADKITPPPSKPTPAKTPKPSINKTTQKKALPSLISAPKLSAPVIKPPPALKPKAAPKPKAPTASFSLFGGAEPQTTRPATKPKAKAAPPKAPKLTPAKKSSPSVAVSKSTSKAQTEPFSLFGVGATKPTSQNVKAAAKPKPIARSLPKAPPKAKVTAAIAPKLRPAKPSTFKSKTLAKRTAKTQAEPFSLFGDKSAKATAPKVAPVVKSKPTPPVKVTPIIAPKLPPVVKPPTVAKPSPAATATPIKPPKLRPAKSLPTAKPKPVAKASPSEKPAPFSLFGGGTAKPAAPTRAVKPKPVAKPAVKAKVAAPKAPKLTPAKPKPVAKASPSEKPAPFSLFGGGTAKPAAPTRAVKPKPVAKPAVKAKAAAPKAPKLTPAKPKPVAKAPVSEKPAPFSLFGGGTTKPAARTPTVKPKPVAKPAVKAKAAAPKAPKLTPAKPKPVAKAPPSEKPAPFSLFGGGTTKPAAPKATAAVKLSPRKAPKKVSAAPKASTSPSFSVFGNTGKSATPKASPKPMSAVKGASSPAAEKAKAFTKAAVGPIKKVAVPARAKESAKPVARSKPAVSRSPPSFGKKWSTATTSTKKK